MGFDEGNSNEKLSPRDTLLEKFSEKEKAIFFFLENIYKKEQETANEPVKVHAVWNYGRSTKNLVESTIKYQNAYLLPLPHNRNSYEAFSILIGYIPSEEEKKLPYSELIQKIQQYPRMGSSDIRIYDLNDKFKFFANIGRLDNMQKEWSDLLDTIQYPIFVEDRQHGVVFENAACQKINY